MTARTAHVIRSASHGAGLIIAALAVAAAILLASRAGIAGPPDGAIDPSMGLEVSASSAAGAGSKIRRASEVGSGAPNAGPAIAVGPDTHPAAAAPQANEVRQFWRHGENVTAAVAGLLALLGWLLKVDRKRAAYYTAGMLAIGGCTDAIANGQTPNLGMVIGVAAAFVLYLMRSPLQPAPAAPRQPESGTVRLHLLSGIALCIAVLIALTSSCSGAKHAGTVVKDSVVDCSKLTAEAHAAEYVDRIERAVRAGTAPNGEVSWTPAKREIASILADAGLDVAGCAAATAVARLLSFAPAPVGIVAAPEPSRARLLDGWQSTRAEMFGERRFAVAVEGL